MYPATSLSYLKNFFFYVGFKIVKRTKWKRLAEIDVTSGRREMDLPAILAEVSLLSSFFLVGMG